jgi:replicative DNA helicase
MLLPELEAAVAGMIMAAQENLAEAMASGLWPEHFSDPLCGEVYRAASEIWLKGEAVDMPTVVRRIGFTRLDAVRAIRAAAPVTANFAPYLNGVLEAHQQAELQRRLVEISRRLSQRRLLDPLAPVVEGITSLVAYCQGASPDETLETALEVADKALAAAEQRIVDARAGKAPGVTSGYPPLDRVIYGFQKGFVYVLGARTGVGKTTFALNVALRAAQAGHRVAFASVEMGNVDLAEKAIACLSRVHQARYLAGTLTDDELDKVAGGVRTLASLPLKFLHLRRPTIERLEFQIFRLVMVEKVELVVVDYLQLFEAGDGRHRPSREEAKLVSAKLKSIAQRLDVPLLVLSQLNRQAPETGEPELIHIAESDQIARDADVVMFLYRDAGLHYLSVAKQRRGMRAALRLNAELQFSSFEVRDGRP